MVDFIISVPLPARCGFFCFFQFGFVVTSLGNEGFAAHCMRHAFIRCIDSGSDSNGGCGVQPFFNLSLLLLLLLSIILAIVERLNSRPSLDSNGSLVMSGFQLTPYLMALRLSFIASHSFVFSYSIDLAMRAQTGLSSSGIGFLSSVIVLCYDD